MLAFLFGLSVLGLLLNLFAKKPHKLILVITSALIFLSGWNLFAGGLLSKLDSFPRLEVTDWKPKTIIVILGAGLIENPVHHTVTLGTFGYSRVLEGLRLYQACLSHQGSCRILVSGGDPGRHKVTEADWMAKMLEESGVAKSDLILEDKSNNTYQNAKFTRAVLQSLTYDRILLVTSSFHMQRSVLLFTAFSIPVVPAPSDQWQAIDSLFPVAYNLAMVDLALHEYFGMLQFFYYEWRGLNKN